ncbi:MAG TPA: DUF4169 family protein [Novosphingobium sp.]
MVEIINLRLARKARQRREAAATAAENRARFGQTRSERQREKAERQALARTVDGARRDPTPPPSGPDES